MPSSRSTRATLAALAALCATAWASSHREAPFVTEHPKVDGTDFYLFNSYEAGREDFVTIIANYVPLQDPYGGPNYCFLDPDAIYEIHVDNDGDAKPDITFTFDSAAAQTGFELTVGPPDNSRTLTVPLIAIAPISVGNADGHLYRESFKVKVAVDGSSSSITNAADGSKVFAKPIDNIGNKTIPDYAAYAAQFLYDIDLPGGLTGRMFVGQRKDPFVVNLGEAFDLVNTNPLGAENGELDQLADANVTSFVLELPKTFLAGNDDVIAAWTTASMRSTRVLTNKPTLDNPAIEKGSFQQVSRLANPLVNELVIGLDKKDLFNASEPKKDAKNFLDFVTHPTFPELLEILFPSVTAPNLFPRTDLVQVFLTGVPGLNEKVGGTPYEAMRLNMAIAAVPAGMQSRLGVLGGDTAGYPNGRRPGDDVVDITLRAAMGVLLDSGVAPSGQLAFTDGALVDDSFFDATFPYVKTPLAGSPSN